MKKDAAIEEIRRTRHEISAEYDHDIRKLLDHYQSMETEYADRMLGESGVPEHVNGESEKVQCLKHPS